MTEDYAISFFKVVFTSFSGCFRTQNAWVKNARSFETRWTRGGVLYFTQETVLVLLDYRFRFGCRIVAWCWIWTRESSLVDGDFVFKRLDEALTSRKQFQPEVGGTERNWHHELDECAIMAVWYYGIMSLWNCPPQISIMAYFTISQSHNVATNRGNGKETGVFLKNPKILFCSFPLRRRRGFW